MMSPQTPLSWSLLLHLSFNMWFDRPKPEVDTAWGAPPPDFFWYQDELRCDDGLWRDLTERMADVAEIFGGPRLFHLGYDEEILFHQRRNDYVVIRQHDLWWRGR